MFSSMPDFTHWIPVVIFPPIVTAKQCLQTAACSLVGSRPWLEAWCIATYPKWQFQSVRALKVLLPNS